MVPSCPDSGWLSQGHLQPEIASRMYRSGSLLCLLLMLTSSGVARGGTHGADCLAGAVAQPVQIARVTDGDTVVLSDGQRVRLIGLNTPELNAAVARDQALAGLAKQALQKFLEGEEITLIPGRDTLDSYGRTLAHIRLADGRDAANALIAAGLGVAVAVGANTRCADALLALEHAARRARVGIWALPGERFRETPVPGSQLHGFHMLTGRVLRSSGHERKRYLEMESGLKVHLGSDWPEDTTNTQAFLDSVTGRHVEVRGWFVSRAGRAELTLHHPLNLEIIEKR